MGSVSGGRTNEAQVVEVGRGHFAGVNAAEELDHGRQLDALLHRHACVGRGAAGRGGARQTDQGGRGLGRAETLVRSDETLRD